MTRILAAFLVVAWAASASAETWEWVDSGGTVSFTDDLQNIPRQYRKKARRLDGGTPPAPPSSVPPPGAQGNSALPSPVVFGQPDLPGAKPQGSYGGKSALQWKEAFTVLNGDLRGVDGELKEKQRLLRESGSINRSDYLKLEDEIRQLNFRLTALLARWDLLSKEAAAASVPGELRQ